MSAETVSEPKPMPSIHFDPDPDGERVNVEEGWSGEFLDLAGELSLYFANEGELLKFIATVIEQWAAVGEGTVTLKGIITLYGDDKTAPTALHDDDGRLEMEREEWKRAAKDESETP